MAFVAAFTDGVSCLRNFPSNQNCRSTLRVLEQLGIRHEELEPGTVTIYGRGGRFTPPSDRLDCGNSGTTARLLMGLLASQPFEAVIDGDHSLRSRSMREVETALREWGMEIVSLGESGFLPVRTKGSRIQGRSFALPSPDTQLKDTILLAGLQAEGTTCVREPLPTRDHMARAFSFAGIEVKTHEDTACLRGGQTPRSIDATIPGDVSSGAYWLALAAPVEGSRVILRDVSLNRHRLGFVDALVHMGAGVREEVLTCHDEEWYGHLDIRGGTLQPFHVTQKMVPSLIDEIPLLAVMAAKASGVSTIREMRATRGKKMDRIDATARNLRRMGVRVETFADGMAVHGSGRLRGAELDSFGDHRIAMTFAVAGFLAEGDSIIRQAECMPVSYPEFLVDLDILINSTNRHASLASNSAFRRTLNKGQV